MDDRAQRRAAVLADLDRAIRRRELRRLQGAGLRIPAIVNTSMVAAMNRARRDDQALRAG